jgi:hypothetical protein
MYVIVADHVTQFLLLKGNTEKRHGVKGTVSRDFLLLVFSRSSFPSAPEYSIKTVMNFSKIRGDIYKSRCTTGINNTGGKFFNQFR